MATFCERVGEGIPDVIVPIGSDISGAKTFAPSIAKTSADEIHKNSVCVSVLTSRWSTLDDKTNSPPLRSLLQLPQHLLGADKPAPLSPLFPDDPAQPSLDG